MSEELLPGMAGADGGGEAGAGPDRSSPPRLRRPQRHQVVMVHRSVDEGLRDDHPARTAWELVGRMDLGKFTEVIAARGATPGRAATDPALLAALWLYATMDGVGSARRLARLCQEHDAYRWLCGGVSLNHHTLSDFRVGHGKALDDLLTQMVTVLRASGVIDGERVSQDSLRVRAGAGKSSYRRRDSLKRLEEEARRRVEELRVKVHDPDDQTTDQRKRAAQERAARERLERVRGALALLPELEAIKQNQTGKPSKNREPRVSTTDPQARRMKRGDGSIGPAYSVQIATEPASRAILGVCVHTGGDDQSQSGPMRTLVQERTKTAVKEHLYDGGYVDKEEIEAAARADVKVYAPLPRGKDGQPCTSGRGDTPGVTRWRERMTGPQAKEVYTLRASTSETVNADLSAHRGLTRLNVRGPGKVLCVALWAALAYMAVQLSAELLAALPRA